MYDIPAAFWTAGAKHWDMAGTKISLDIFPINFAIKFNVIATLPRKNRRRNMVTFCLEFIYEHFNLIKEAVDIVSLAKKQQSKTIYNKNAFQYDAYRPLIDRIPWFSSFRGSAFWGWVCRRPPPLS